MLLIISNPVGFESFITFIINYYTNNTNNNNNDKLKLFFYNFYLLTLPIILTERKKLAKVYQNLLKKLVNSIPELKHNKTTRKMMKLMEKPKHFSILLNIIKFLPKYHKEIKIFVEKLKNIEQNTNKTEESENKKIVKIDEKQNTKYPKSEQETKQEINNILTEIVEIEKEIANVNKNIKNIKNEKKKENDEKNNPVNKEKVVEINNYGNFEDDLFSKHNNSLINLALSDEKPNSTKTTNKNINKKTNFKNQKLKNKILSFNKIIGENLI